VFDLKQFANLDLLAAQIAPAIFLNKDADAPGFRH
jgi:hypothetical protein